MHEGVDGSGVCCGDDNNIITCDVLRAEGTEDALVDIWEVRREGRTHRPDDCPAAKDGICSPRGYVSSADNEHMLVLQVNHHGKERRPVNVHMVCYHIIYHANIFTRRTQKLRRIYRLVVVLAMCAVLAGSSDAFIRDGAVRGRKGLSFGSISYAFDTLSVTIRNSNSHNVNFGGSMIFLDRNYRVVARAELMTEKIKRRSSRRYKGYFTEGSGNEAQSAQYLEWEF